MSARSAAGLPHQNEKALVPGRRASALALSSVVLYLRSRVRQLKLFTFGKIVHGGDHRNKRAGRGARPLDTRNSMHLVLRSTRAVGKHSFARHRQKVCAIVEKFALKYGIKVISLANVGNHLHFQIKLGNRHAYRPFIRAVTAAIAMAVTGVSRWKKSEGPFWDQRPFTRVVIGRRAFLTLKNYIEINRLEGQGYDRELARMILDHTRGRPSSA